MAVQINGTTGITTPKLDALDLELGSKNVVERGSNANGDYVRFADGTQICTFEGALQDVTSVSGNMFITTALSAWTCPADFFTNPTFSGQAESATNRVVTFVFQGTSGVYYRQMGASSSATAVQTRLSAIGRWY